MTSDHPEAKAQKSALPFVLAFIVGVLGVYWFNSAPRKEETPVAASAPATGALSKAYATGAVAGVIVHDKRKDIPAFSFAGADGAFADLSKWKGRVVLLNLWATWCTPCRKEMPDLADLQKQLGGAEFEVVTLSIDQKGYDASAAFLKEIGATNLALYVDPTMKAMGPLQAIGLPATILIDRQGKEAARILGPAKWNAPEAVAMVKALMAEK
jgi:thiol-disulfide isomerase/thioredoxin